MQVCHHSTCNYYSINHSKKYTRSSACLYLKKLNSIKKTNNVTTMSQKECSSTNIEVSFRSINLNQNISNHVKEQSSLNPTNRFMSLSHRVKFKDQKQYWNWFKPYDVVIHFIDVRQNHKGSDNDDVPHCK